ncbi:MAG: DUF1428 domain-containing protein [Pseudomonadota bacterium]
MASPTENATHAMVYMDRFFGSCTDIESRGLSPTFRSVGSAIPGNQRDQQVECRGDDIPDGHVTSFPKAIQCKEDETVIAGWLIWPSKDTCDAAWETVLQAPHMNNAGNPMPFDSKRLIHGGFETIFES